MLAKNRKYPYENPKKLYTLEEAEFIIKEKSTKRKEEKIEDLLQKLSGMVMIVLGILCPIIDHGDATASLFIIPIGLCLFLINDDNINFDE